MRANAFDKPGNDCPQRGRYRMLPREVCHQCIWTVRDMPRLRQVASFRSCRSEAQGIVLYMTEDDILIRSEVADRAEEVLECIDSALECVPEAYREGIIDNIILRTDFDINAHTNTWKKWKRIFLYELAVRMMLV